MIIDHRNLVSKMGSAQDRLIIVIIIIIIIMIINIDLFKKKINIITSRTERSGSAHIGLSYTPKDGSNIFFPLFL